MTEVWLTYPTPEGSKQIALDGESLTVGRGAVDLRFDDQSLSRHHATVYRDGDRVWILDENSTNGTFVNGAEVAPSGTPLYDGDSVRLGNETIFTVRIRQSPVAKTTNNEQRTTNNGQKILLIVAGLAVFIIGLSVIIIGASLLGAGKKSDVVVVSATPEATPKPDESEGNDNDNSNSAISSPNNSNSVANANSANNNSDEIIVDRRPPQKPPQPDKTYQLMSETEKLQFVQREAEQVAQMIGNRSGQPVTPEALAKIKEMVDGYARRLRAARKDDCTARGWVSSDLQSVLERGKQNAHFVVRSFNTEGVAPQIGLYLAMIESEFCPRLQSPTKPLGMFQFTQATGANYGLKTVSGATPENCDERCEPEKAAAAAARFMKALMGRFGTGPSSVPLAVASYNSGEGGLSRNLNTMLEEAGKKTRDFWSLMLVADRLSEQFQKENRKYVPKFFAAAIVGENPTVFGVNIPPLSTATN